MDLNFENKSDYELFKKAIDRVERSNGGRPTKTEEVIIFLAKEVERYRDNISHLEANIDGMKERTARLEQQIGKMYGECIKIQPSETLETVQESTAGEIIKALADNGYKTITLNFYKED